MKKTLLILGVAIASLSVGSAFAQTSGPSQDMAAPAAAATPAEKADAKQARKTIGKSVSQGATSGDDHPTSAGTTKVSKSEKSLAKAKRKSAGAAATKAPKDPSTGAGGSD